ncbi:MAG: pseudouridine synthase [Gammaproteobacteria bacterium]|nr:pseudouridine synthase [Gammaproteobacteria bacterium]
MITSPYPSVLSLPQINPGVVTVLEYLIIKFPRINPAIWRQRMSDGKVHRHDHSLITAQSPFKAQERIYYYREVESEPVIAAAEAIIYQDAHILVAYKPHFLPVIPGGVFVNECLQNRLRRATGIKSLQAVHRLDRVTAGLVIFSVNPATRHLYHHLFESGQIQKTYQAIARINDGQQLIGKHLVGKSWEVNNRLVRSQPRFTMQVVEGESNSHSIITCIEQSVVEALFELRPITGKTHQLRVHMQCLGFGIKYDKYYPVLQPLSSDNIDAPLQLLAKTLDFIDPVINAPRSFSAARNLSLSPTTHVIG